jgi:DNA-binding transcriptional LysR family regulator
VAAPGYLARHGTPQHPLDLERGHRSVIYFSPVSTRRHPLEFHKDGEVIEIAGPSLLSVNESNAYVSALVANQGVGQITTFQAQQHIEHGELVRVLADWSHPLLPVYVVYPPNRHLSAKVRAFVDWVVELFASDPRLQRP